MQTHKNPALRSGPAPFKPVTPTKPGGGAPSQPSSKPPVFKRDGKKWLIVSYFICMCLLKSIE